MRSDDLYALPENLPEPMDDGRCDHLVGAAVPDVDLPSTRRRLVSLARASEARCVVVYCYPRTGLPNQDPPKGWNQLPGARGCTPQTCGFRDHHEAFRGLGIDVFGLSVQSTEYQREMVERLHVPFEVLSDEGQVLTTAMRLPTFEVEHQLLLLRVTLVLWRARVERVFYPVFPPDKNAAIVLAWLRALPSPGA